MNDLLKPLPWQQELWLELTASVLAGRLHHALLLAGPAGVGKRRFVRALTAFMLCEQRSGYACGECRSCQQFIAGTQPNAHWLGLDGHLALSLAPGNESALVHWQPEERSKRKEISIEAVRSLIGMLALSSHYGQAKIAAIEPADALSISGANSLLKLIEEPTARTHLLLVAERPMMLPATLRSRCQGLRFGTPAPEVAAEWLRAQAPNAGQEILQSAQGAPLRALDLIESGRVEQQAQWQEWMQRLAEHKTDPLTVSGDVGKDDAAAFFAWLAPWICGRLRDSLRAGQAPGPAALARFAGAATESQRRLEGNAKPELVLDALMIQWWNIHRARKAA